MNIENWDDLRFVIKVAELGSVLKAAKSLGVTHATVLRRVSAFEARHGTPVFERTPQGYRLAADQRHLLEAARVVETAMSEVSRLGSGGARPVQGVVRVTTTDSFAQYVLPDFVAASARDLTGVNIFVQSSNAHVDLLRSEAHIALRPALSLTEDLIGVQVATLPFACFRAKGANAPRHWLRLSGPLARTEAARLMTDALSEDQFGPGADSFLTLMAMAEQGGGIAVLPTYLGDASPVLERIDSPFPMRTVPIWVARHADTRYSRAARLVEERLVQFMRSRATGPNGALQVGA